VFANLGTWMQSIAQDWLVLSLTRSATAVGITMALQFLPILLLGVHGGALADRWPKRRLLLGTQLANALLTGALAVLTLSGAVHVIEVYAFALLSGFVFVVDGPARQSFVGEVVPSADLRGAISLNSAVFQSTRLIGPALAGVLVETVGTGWAFAANALCYLGPTIALLRVRGLCESQPVPTRSGALRDTARYVLERPRVAITIALVAVVGTLGLNYPVVLTAMASRTFSGNAGTYALFNILLAIGSVSGAVVAGGLSRSRLRWIVVACAAFGAAQACAALAPDLPAFLGLLTIMGATNLAFQAMANSSVQLWVDSQMRGRVMGLYMLVFAGGTPLGAPVIGALTNAFGPRLGMFVCGAAPALAAVVLVVMWRRREPAVRG
jgi:MFS family permease